MKILNIYEANNGDVFFKHDCMLAENVDTKEIEDTISLAKKLYNDGIDVIKCEARENDNPIPHIAYYYNGEFLGDAGMHITEKYDIFQDAIYIKRVSKETVNEKLVKKIKSRKGAR